MPTKMNRLQFIRSAIASLFASYIASKIRVDPPKPYYINPSDTSTVTTSNEYGPVYTFECIAGEKIQPGSFVCVKGDRAYCMRATEGGVDVFGIA